MKIIRLKKILIFSGLLTGLFNFTGCTSPLEADSNIDRNNTNISSTEVNQFPSEELNEGEIYGLIFMREEEKLARDVYNSLYAKWGRRVFSNISQSEQRHTNAIKLLLEKYDLEDPVKIDTLGNFQNEVLQELYNTLTEQGNASLVEALKVGALIEEIDILDIQKELDEHVDNQDITFVYQNLLKGSRNHLRAFVRNLSSQGVEYAPQKLSEEQYMEIINSSHERGRSQYN